MANNARNNSGGRRWLAALLVFLVGVVLLLLAVFGPVFWGDAFDGNSLKTPAWGLIVVSCYVLLGVSIPALLSGKGPDDNDNGKGQGDG